MSTVLIARFKTKEEAESAAISLKNRAEVHIEEDLDNLTNDELVRLIDEGMESEDVDFGEFMSELKERISRDR